MNNHKYNIRAYNVLFFLFLNTAVSPICCGMDNEFDKDFHHPTLQAPITDQYEESDSTSSVENRDNVSLDTVPLEESSLTTISTNPISHAYISVFQDSEEETSHLCLGIKYTLSFLGGFGAGIPAIGASLKAGEYYGSIELGYYFATATILSAGGIVSWATWELIEDGQESIRNSLRHKSISSSSICTKEFAKSIVKASISFILGALSTVPDVYAAYKYNTTKEIAVLSFIYEIVPRTLGFYKFISLLGSKIGINESEQETIVKEKGREFIDLTKAYFLKSTKENGIEDVQLQLANYMTSKDIYAFLSSNAQQGLIKTEAPLPAHYAKGIPRKTSQAASLIFPIANAIVNTVLTYKGFSLLTDDPVLLPILTGISILPSFFLNAYATMQVAGGMFNKCYFLCNHSNLSASDYFDVFHPKTKYALMASAVTVVASTAGSGAYIILDNLNNTTLSPAKYPLAGFAMISSVTFGSYAVTSTLINFGESIMKHCNKTTSYLFNCLKKLDDAGSLIISSSTEYVRNFISETTPNFPDIESLEDI